MKIIKSIEVDEKQLHAFISKNPSVIEDGFEIIKNEARLEGLERADILGLDATDTMTVCELKAVTADTMELLQLLKYGNFIIDDPFFVFSRFAGINKTLTSFNPEVDLRLILVAPQFSDDILQLKGVLTLNIELIQYRAYDLGDGEIGFSFSPIKDDLTNSIFVKPTKTVEEHLARIEDPVVLATANELIDKLLALEGVQKSATQSYIKLSIHDKYNIAGIYTYKQSISLWYKRPDSGDYTEWNTEEEVIIKLRTLDDISTSGAWEHIVNKHSKLLESYKTKKTV